MSKNPSENNLSVFIWAGTILVASAILGFCVFIAVHRQVSQQPAQVMPPSAAVAPPPVQQQPVKPAPAPAQQVVKTAPPPVVTPQAQPPAQATGPKLQLDHLAGTLKMDLPFLAAGGGDRIPLDYTCYRKNMSPALSWKSAPASTKSYVVFFEKRTVETGEEPAVNWILFDIPASTNAISSGQPRDPTLPNGAKQGNTDGGMIGYAGPCERKGRFTYALRVFALDTVLNLQPGISKPDLIRAMNGHIVDAAEKTFVHYYRL